MDGFRDPLGQPAQGMDALVAMAEQEIGLLLAVCGSALPGPAGEVERDDHAPAFQETVGMIEEIERGVRGHEEPQASADRLGQPLLDVAEEIASDLRLRPRRIPSAGLRALGDRDAVMLRNIGILSSHELLIGPGPA